MVGIDNINCELAPSDIYSGMYGRVTIRFFGYSNSGTRASAAAWAMSSKPVTGSL